MERKQFLKSIFAVCLAAAIKDASILKLADGPVTDLPGIKPEVFKLTFNADWFRHGDVLKFDSMATNFLFTNRDGQPMLKEIVQDGVGREFLVEFNNDPMYKQQTEDKARKVCSAMIMEVEPDREVFMMPMEVITNAV